MAARKIPKSVAAKARLGKLLRDSGLLRAGDRVCVAVSGGADSVALLRLLLEWREEFGIVLSVGHFNHQLRGRSSDGDEKFVARLAERYGLPFHTGCLDVRGKAQREKANLEDAARRARYAFFATLVADDLVSKIAVAHTADDQAETVLAHLLRGSGLAGMSGIHPTSGAIIRPLLAAGRSDLRAYLRSIKQAWREDASNRDTTKMRARIRKKLLPLLKRTFQPAVVQHLATLANHAREDNALLEALVAARLGGAKIEGGEPARVSVKELFSFPRWNDEGKNPVNSEAMEALARRTIRFIVKNVKTGEGQLTSQHVESVLNLARCGNNGTVLQLPGGLEVRRERDSLVFCAAQIAFRGRTAKTARNYEYAIQSVGSNTTVAIAELGCVFRFTIIDWPCKRGETRSSGKVLDYARLKFPLILRNWRPGDRLRPAGHRSAQKLKRLFNAERIARWDRDGWPVLCSGETLAWVRGFGASADFAAGESTHAALTISEEKT